MMQFTMWRWLRRVGVLLVLFVCALAWAWEPANYFDEPKLPFDEEIQEQKQEAGWHWQEFRFTSQVYDGEPIRFHAVYGVPDAATAQQKVPGILMTHGIFGAIRGQDARYWNAFSTCVKAGYAVLFIDWYPDFAHNYVAKDPNELKRFTTYGKIDYFKPYYSYWKTENDFRDSLPFQVAIAAKRAVTWLQARPEVDGARIGATGASYGGIFSSMFAGIDSRIVAVNPCVYTAGFGPTERGYNAMGFTGATLTTWKARFDSQVLLAKRPVEVLYTVGSNDGAFLLTKAMDNYASMTGPKHMVIGPNAGHDFWAVDQTVRFFDSALKKQFAWSVADGLTVRREGQEIVATVRAAGDTPRKVEFFATTIYEIDPDKLPSTILADGWRWIGREATTARGEQYTGRWPVPVMRPVNPQERLYMLGSRDMLDPKNPPAADPVPAEQREGLVRVFARVTDAHGAVTCTPLSESLVLTEQPAEAPRITRTVPALEAAVRVKTATTVQITPDMPAGQPMATFTAPLPVQAVGTHGYVVWNWRKNTDLLSTLVTDGVATPMKKVLAPFADTIPQRSFTGCFPWPQLNRGGLVAFAINGKPDEVDARGRAYHGSVPIDTCAEVITLDPQDTAEHRLTLVMAGGGREACNVRVSLFAADGAAETVAYRHLLDSDCLLQFRFTGKVTLRVQVTARVLDNVINTHIGPTALFLD
jgi:dienelactone hydrolase